MAKKGSKDELTGLQAGMAELNKLFGDTNTFYGEDDFIEKVDVTSSGSLELDDAIGVGGWPAGRIILLSGIESSGKTLITLTAIKEAQKEGYSAMFVDAEYTFDKKWAAGLGVDLSKLIVTRNNDAQKIFELLLGKPKTDKRKNAINGILDNEDILNSGLRYIVIDSINALIPPMELTADVGQVQMTTLARFLPPVLRNLTAKLAERNITLFFIMQSRQDPSNPKAGTQISGGKALKHAASQWFDLAPIGGSKIETKEGLRIGHRIRAKNKKNKIAPPFREAESTVFYNKGIDVRPEIFDQAVKYGIIARPNNVMYEHESFPDGKIRGVDAAKAFMMADKDLMKKFLEEIKIKKQDLKDNPEPGSDEIQDDDPYVEDVSEDELAEMTSQKEESFDDSEFKEDAI